MKETKEKPRTFWLWYDNNLIIASSLKPKPTMSGLWKSNAFEMEFCPMYFKRIFGWKPARKECPIEVYLQGTAVKPAVKKP